MKLGPALLPMWWVAAIVIVAATLLGRSAADSFQSSDGAILELFTIHASRGLWEWGPYSQFGWHHPGPLLFYLNVPFYILSGQKAISLNAAALAINILSLCLLLWVIARREMLGLLIATSAVLVTFFWKLNYLLISPWNPHVIVLPAAVFLVLAAAVATRGFHYLPLTVAVGSYLLQTHVSTGPFVVTVVLCACALAWPGRVRASQAGGRAWIVASALVVLVLWLPPLIEWWRAGPNGNLSLLFRYFFFGSPEGLPLSQAAGIWLHALGRFLDVDMTIPVGHQLQLTGESRAPLLALVQLVLLPAVIWWAQRRNDRFVSRLSVIVLAASLTVLWSIGRIPVLVGDYQVFWMSAIGALTTALICAVPVQLIVERLSASPLASARTIQTVTSLVVIGVAGWIGLGQVLGARAQAEIERVDPPPAMRFYRAVSSHLSREHLARPLIRTSTGAWGEAAVVLLRLYKTGHSVAGDPGLVPLFGAPLLPNGLEDIEYWIIDSSALAAAEKAGGELLAAQDVSGQQVLVFVVKAGSAGL